MRRRMAQGPRPKAQGPRPKAQGPRPKAQGPRPKAQGPRPMAQWSFRTAGVNGSSVVPALAKFACARNGPIGAPWRRRDPCRVDPPDPVPGLRAHKGNLCGPARRTNFWELPPGPNDGPTGDRRASHPTTRRSGVIRSQGQLGRNRRQPTRGGALLCVCKLHERWFRWRPQWRPPRSRR
jgi:hypothetical protein